MKNRVKEFRTMKGLTALALSDKAGITSQSLLYIESGKQLPSVKTALRLARLLNVPVAELFILN